MNRKHITKIALHGSNFSRNFGDTLLTRIAREWVHEFDSEIQCISPFVGSQREADEIGTTMDSEIETCDALVYCGGGYFGEPDKSFLRKLRWSHRNWRRHLGWFSRVKTKRIPIAIIGIGVGPLTFYPMRRRIRKIFEYASIASVRDQESLEFLRSHCGYHGKCEVTTDSALALKPKNDILPVFSKETCFTLGVHLATETERTRQAVDALAAACKKYPNLRLVFIEDEVGKFSYCKNLLRPLLDDNPKVFEYEGPDQLINLIHQLDGVITSKLHVGIVATALHVPVLSVPNHPKTRRFYSSIDRQDDCIQDDVFKRVASRISELITSVSKPTITGNNTECALRNRDLLHQFLTDTRSS